MTPRFRVVAGPNGSGKTTLARRLAADYAVNFYDVVNADDIFAEVRSTGGYAPRIPVDGESLRACAAASSYAESVKAPFLDGHICISAGCVRFMSPDAANSYTVALLAGFLQREHVRQGVSFSQETVFSHPSKIDALREAHAAGFRTYLYFVATESPAINIARVESRAALGGHSVPIDKVASRYPLSVANAAAALPHLSRAFFFDNSGETMRFFAEWSEDSGLVSVVGPADAAPAWFSPISAAANGLAVGSAASFSPAPDGAALAASAAAASREAIARAFAAGLSVTVMRGGRIVRLSAGDGSAKGETP